MNIGQINANILRVWLSIARYMGLVSVRFKSSKDNVISLEDRSWWKWFAVIQQLVPLCICLYRFNQFIRTEEIFPQMVHALHVIVLTSTSLSLSHLQIFHGHELIKLLNRYFYLQSQIRSLGFKDALGFGGGRELLMIVIFYGFQIYEFVFVSVSYAHVFGAVDIAFWTSHCYITIAINMIINLNFISYLGLGVLYTEMQKLLCMDLHQESKIIKLSYKSQKRLKRTMCFFSEICAVVTSLQRINNGYLLFDQFQKYFYVVFVAHEMLLDLEFLKLWHWAIIITVMLRLFVFILAIQRAINKFSCIQEFTLGLFFASDLTDWNKTVEVFATHLNLYKFRVRLLNLFDVSNKWFLLIMSGVLNYFVFVVQFVMQTRLINNCKVT